MERLLLKRFVSKLVKTSLNVLPQFCFRQIRVSEQDGKNILESDRIQNNLTVSVQYRFVPLRCAIISNLENNI